MFVECICSILKFWLRLCYNKTYHLTKLLLEDCWIMLYPTNWKAVVLQSSIHAGEVNFPCGTMFISFHLFRILMTQNCCCLICNFPGNFWVLKFNSCDMFPNLTLWAFLFTCVFCFLIAQHMPLISKYSIQFELQWYTVWSSSDVEWYTMISSWNMCTWLHFCLNAK